MSKKHEKTNIISMISETDTKYSYYRLCYNINMALMLSRDYYGNKIKIISLVILISIINVIKLLLIKFNHTVDTFVYILVDKVDFRKKFSKF